MYIIEWNGVELGRAPHALSLEGALYFPPDAVNTLALSPSSETSYCEWKGANAQYFDIHAKSETNAGSVWRYDELGPDLAEIQGWYSFWRGVDVRWTGEGPANVRELGHQMPNVAKALKAEKVAWRASPAFLGDDIPFTGYVIPELGIAVDVLSDPGADAREAVIAQARERAEDCVAYAKSYTKDGNPGCGYIAVWGSTPPSAQAVEALLEGKSVLELENSPEIIS